MNATLKIILINNENKILALRRSGTDPRRQHTWDLPGGVLEHGEILEDAIKREPPKASHRGRGYSPLFSDERCGVIPQLFRRGTPECGTAIVEAKVASPLGAHLFDKTVGETHRVGGVACFASSIDAGKNASRFNYHQHALLFEAARNSYCIPSARLG